MAKPYFPLLLFLLLRLSCRPIHCQHTRQEAFDILGIAWNDDGTLNRTIQIPMVDPTPTADSDPKPTALSRDISISSSTKVSARLYLPLDPPKTQKLPLIIYVHGGDFVLFSASTVIFHNFCNAVASQLPAVVISVDHRLAPENRLPAAFDDAVSAILWARNQALNPPARRDPWLNYADFSRTFLLGSSAGANIVYNAALRAAGALNLRPLKLIGLLLNQAYFGGENRTQSEITLQDDPYVPLFVNDVLWTLALPENFSRDHEYSNPISDGKYKGRVPRLPRVYVKGDYGDPLVDRSVRLVELLKACKVPVYSRFNDGGFHGIELQNATAAQQLYDDMKWFVNNVTGVGMPEGITASDDRLRALH